MAGGERVFKGRTAQERRDERRARLHEAALEIIGTRGWPEATMTEICRTARLTERYFYESYRSREELYVALVDGLGRELREAVLTAVSTVPADEAPARVRAGARALVDLLVGDPRKGRAALLEGIGTPALERRRREIIGGFVELLDEERSTFFGDAPMDPAHRALSSTAIAGALTAIVARRLDGTLTVTDDELVDYLTELGIVLGLPAQH